MAKSKIVKAKTDALTDEEIVALTLKNKDFYLYIMKRYETKLSRYITRIANFRPEDSEDILQEVFLKAYLNLYDFDRKLKFSSWIYRICHNEVISFWRKKKPENADLQLFENSLHLAVTSPIYQELEIKLNKEKIDIILAQMPINFREIMVLRYFEEREYVEISDILKIPINTVGTLISRAKKIFKKLTMQNKIKF
jgi:RNA polymerase sigma-70 factor (ECF subfamily)